MLFAAIVGSIVVCYPHNYQESQSSELSAHKKIYPQLIANRDSAYFQLKRDLVAGKITATEFDKEFNNIFYTYKADNKAYNKKKKEIQANDAVIGYTSKKNFLLGIAFPLSLFLTVLILFNSKIKELNQEKRKFHLLAYGAMLLNATHWVAWSFLFKTNSRGEYDFENWQYALMLYVLPILVTIGSYFLFKYYKAIEWTTNKMLGVFWKSHYEELEQQDLVNPEKINEFKLHRLKVTEEVISYE